MDDAERNGTLRCGEVLSSIKNVRESYGICEDLHFKIEHSKYCQVDVDDGEVILYTKPSEVPVEDAEKVVVRGQEVTFHFDSDGTVKRHFYDALMHATDTMHDNPTHCSLGSSTNTVSPDEPLTDEMTNELKNLRGILDNLNESMLLEESAKLVAEQRSEEVALSRTIVQALNELVERLGLDKTEPVHFRLEASAYKELRIWFVDDGMTAVSLSTNREDEPSVSIEGLTMYRQHQIDVDLFEDDPALIRGRVAHFLTGVDPGNAPNTDWVELNDEIRRDEVVFYSNDEFSLRPSMELPFPALEALHRLPFIIAELSSDSIIHTKEIEE